MKILIAKTKSTRTRVKSTGKHLVMSVYGIENISDYQPTKDNKPSQAVVKAEKLFITTETNDTGFISINGNRVGYVNCNSIALNRRGNTLASVRLGLRSI